MSVRDAHPAGTRPGPEDFHVLDSAGGFWPPLWREMNDPPERIWLSGKPEALTGAAIGIVGTRRATPRGLAIACGLGRDLAALGWTVVSGLAAGIDGAAHEGAITGGGLSVGVMATGCDVTYPARHASLRGRLDERGCSLTEFPPGTGPRKYHFPQRNRLIAGMVRAVIVVEAPIRSGALLTAQQALEYNREVFAVPGPVDLSTSAGCHHLLKEGAQLLENVQDVTDVLGLPPNSGALAGVPATASGAEPATGSAARWILDRIDLEGVRRDELREAWPGSENQWQEGLMLLEMGRLIRRLPGGRLARTIWRS